MCVLISEIWSHKRRHAKRDENDHRDDDEARLNIGNSLGTCSLTSLRLVIVDNLNKCSALVDPFLSVCIRYGQTCARINSQPLKADDTN